jgi:hypothetical protein
VQCHTCEFNIATANDSAFIKPFLRPGVIVAVHNPGIHFGDVERE